MKTIIWTDTLQTTFMLSTVILIAYTLMQKMDVNVSSVVSLIADSDYSRMFFFDDWTDKKYFLNNFFWYVHGNCNDRSGSRSNAKEFKL